MINERSLLNIEVLAIELEAPLVLKSSYSVSGTIESMRDRHLGYALITDEDKLVGIFTERDVLLSVLDQNEVLQQPVAKLMTPTPVCVHALDTVWRVVSLMHEGGFRQIPVVDDEQKVLACVRHKDIAEYMVNHFAEHILNLPPDPEQLATTPEGA
jgi:CBS domain-containing protein